MPNSVTYLEWTLKSQWVLLGVDLRTYTKKNMRVQKIGYCAQNPLTIIFYFQHNLGRPI